MNILILNSDNNRAHVHRICGNSAHSTGYH